MYFQYGFFNDVNKQTVHGLCRSAGLSTSGLPSFWFVVTQDDKASVSSGLRFAITWLTNTDEILTVYNDPRDTSFKLQLQYFIPNFNKQI